VRSVLDLQGQLIITGSASYASQLAQFKVGLAAALTTVNSTVYASNVTVVSVDVIETRRSMLGIAGTRIVSEVGTDSPEAAATVSEDLETAFLLGDITSSLNSAGLSDVAAVGVRSLKVGTESVAGTASFASVSASSMVAANGSTVAYSANATALIEDDDGIFALLNGLLNAAFSAEDDEDTRRIIIIAASAGGGALLFLLVTYFMCCKGRKEVATKAKA